MARFKRRVRDLTFRRLRVPAGVFLAALKTYVDGWAGYYARYGSSASSLAALDGWIRRRVRQWFWVRWKTSDNRRLQLLRGGAFPRDAAQACHIAGPWRASNHRALNVCSSNARLRKAGLVPLCEHLGRRALA
ncbi:MAG: group II intron maturase-specific domain-containing protein [Fimbriimonas sp.]